MNVRRQSPAVQARRAVYGWLPDLPDQRDVLYAAVRPRPKTLPKQVDLRAGCSPVEDQGALGSCTAQALVGALEFLQNKRRAAFADLSRLFVYYNERVIEHTVQVDSGAMLRDGIKTLKKQGVCTEKKWPYTAAKFAVKPTPACYREALRRQITAYQRLLSVEQMRACLAEGFPFVFGFTVYENFETPEMAKTGDLTMPEPGQRVLGGHAVMAVGYHDRERRFIVRNSWGTAWGQQGYFTIPYDYLADRNLSDDFWVIRDSE